MTYFVIPITKRDRTPLDTLALASVAPYYHSMKEDGILKHSFFDGSAQTLEQFWNIVFNNHVTFTFIYCKDGPDSDMDLVGHMYFTGYYGYCATIHFGLLRKYHSRALEIGKECMNAISQVKRSDGTPFVTSLIGITPVHNIAAIRLAKLLDFEPLATLHKACHLFYENKFVDGLFTRRTFNELVEQVKK